MPAVGPGCRRKKYRNFNQGCRGYHIRGPYAEISQVEEIEIRHFSRKSPQYTYAAGGQKASQPGYGVSGGSHIKDDGRQAKQQGQGKGCDRILTALSLIHI